MLDLQLFKETVVAEVRWTYIMLFGIVSFSLTILCIYLTLLYHTMCTLQIIDCQNAHQFSYSSSSPVDVVSDDNTAIPSTVSPTTSSLQALVMSSISLTATTAPVSAATTGVVGSGLKGYDNEVCVYIYL